MLLHVVSVFTGAAGQYGNLLGIFLDGKEIPQSRRQGITSELGFSETVFVEDAQRGRIQLFTPATELPFAGHAVLGAAWLLRREGEEVPHLRARAGDLAVWDDGDLLWIQGRTQWCPPWRLLQLDSVADVEGAREAPPGFDAVQIWAVEDDEAGVVRARVFAPRFGVHEDEACGSASMLLAEHLGRPLLIRHGKGSEIHVRPTRDGRVDLGGRVSHREVREWPANGG